jgi:hypothetical protein
MQQIAGQLMVLADSKPLASKSTLDQLKTIPGSVRTAVTSVRCDEAALAGKELHDAQAFEASASKWADAEDARLVAEDAARTNVILPLCQAVWGRDAAKADMAHEKANPSGVVDLQRLHDDGETIQTFQAEIDALTPQYVAARHHGFTKWQDEGVCVAEANKPEGS